MSYLQVRWQSLVDCAGKHAVSYTASWFVVAAAQRDLGPAGAVDRGHIHSGGKVLGQHESMPQVPASFIFTAARLPWLARAL